MKSRSARRLGLTAAAAAAVAFALVWQAAAKAVSGTLVEGLVVILGWVVFLLIAGLITSAFAVSRFGAGVTRDEDMDCEYPEYEKKLAELCAGEPLVVVLRDGKPPLLSTASSGKKRPGRSKPAHGGIAGRSYTDAYLNAPLPELANA